DQVDAEDGGLGHVDYREGEQATETADVGDGEGAALDVVRSQFPRPGALCQALHLGSQFHDAQLVDGLDDGHDETSVGSHRHADVVVALDDNLVGGFIDAGVEASVLGQSSHDSLEDEGQVGEPDPAALGHRLEALTQFDEPADVGFVDMQGPHCLEVRGHHLAGDDPAQTAHGNPLFEVGEADG